MRGDSSGWRSTARALESARGHQRRPYHFTNREGDAALSLQTVHTEHAPAAIGPYSQGIIANGFLFTAGQIALDPTTAQIIVGDVVAQTEQVFKNLSAILDAAGATWTDVVKATVF